MFRLTFTSAYMYLDLDLILRHSSILMDLDFIILLIQICIGIDDILLKFFATFGSVLGLQVTVLIRVSQIR